MRITRQILATAAASVLGATAQLHAQVIQFQGGVTGCFFFGSGGCSPVTSSPFTQYVLADGTIQTTVPASGTNYIEYTGDTFNVETNGVTGGKTLNAALGTSFGLVKEVGTPWPNGAVPFSNLHLQLTFFFAPNFPGTAHPDVGSGNLPTVFSTVVGSVDVHGADINFIFGGSQSSPQLVNIPFTLGGPSGGPYNQSGTFSIYVQDQTIDNSGTNNFIGGRLQVQSTAPEPATVALFATGLVGMIPLARRRKSFSKSA